MFPHCRLHSTSKRFPKLVPFIKIHWRNTTFRKPQRALKQVGCLLSVESAVTVISCSHCKRFTQGQFTLKDLTCSHVGRDSLSDINLSEFASTGYQINGSLGSPETAPSRSNPATVLHFDPIMLDTVEDPCVALVDYYQVSLAILQAVKRAKICSQVCSFSAEVAAPEKLAWP